MQNPAFIIQYVTNPAQAAKEYTALLNAKIVDQSETFVMMATGGGLMIGLWDRTGVFPDPAKVSGEVSVKLPDFAAVDTLYESRKSSADCAPQTRDFGRSFTVTMADGHRIRFFAEGVSAA